MPDIKIGQVWQEVDPRFENLPLRKVIGFAEDGRIILDYISGDSRKTKAKPERFNGKRGGYKLIKDVA